MAAQWFYTRGGRRIGPVPGSVLKQLAAAGDLLPTDLLLKLGTDQWRPASEARGLFSAPKLGNPKEPDEQGLPPNAPSRPTDDDESDAYELTRPHVPVYASSQSALKLPNADRPGTVGEREILILSADGRELPVLSRFFCVHPLGFLAWILLLALMLWIFDSAMIAKEAGAAGKLPDGFRRGAEVLVALIFIPMWFLLRSHEGKGTACPGCKALFSTLLIKDDSEVLRSREGTMTYTGQVAIRDRDFQVAGYIDEERTMPVTNQITLVHRQYRCKACGHRWESRDVKGYGS